MAEMRDAAACMAALPSSRPAIHAAADQIAPVSKPVTTSMSVFMATLDSSESAVPRMPSRIWMPTAAR